MSQKIIKDQRNRMLYIRPCKSKVEYLTHLTGIQVSGVFHYPGIISIMSFLDNRVKQLSKYLKEN